MGNWEGEGTVLITKEERKLNPLLPLLHLSYTQFEEVDDCKMAVEKGKNYQGEKDAIKLRFIKLVE